MNSDSMSKFWLLATGILIAIIVFSSLVIWIHRNNGKAIDILPPQSTQLRDEIYIGGAVSNPGVYPLNPEDTLDDIIQASGGLNYNADISRLSIYVPVLEEDPQPQKVDINRADAWLLEALPGIGNVRAQSIIQYRRQNGLFHSVKELTNIPGITDTTLEKIKNLITLTN